MKLLFYNEMLFFSSHRLRPSYIILRMQSSAILRSQSRKCELSGAIESMATFAPSLVWIWEVVQIVTNHFLIMISVHNLRKQGNRKKITKTSKFLMLFLSIGFFQARSQSALGFALHKSADSRHETVSVDVFPRETVLQDPVER